MAKVENPGPESKNPSASSRQQEHIFLFALWTWSNQLYILYVIDRCAFFLYVHVLMCVVLVQVDQTQQLEFF